VSPRLRATFCTPGDAQDVIRRLHEQGIPDEVIVVDDDADRHRMLLRQQQHEAERTAPLAVEVISPAQAKGALLWACIGTAIGAVAVGSLGLVMTLGQFTRGESIGLFALVGAMAGWSAGFVYGGGRQPEVDGELRDCRDDVTIALDLTTTDAASAAIRIIAESPATDSEYETSRSDPLAGGRRMRGGHDHVDAHRTGP
jgi:hypothetical protein